MSIRDLKRYILLKMKDATPAGKIMPFFLDVHLDNNLKIKDLFKKTNPNSSIINVYTNLDQFKMVLLNINEEHLPLNLVDLLEES